MNKTLITSAALILAAGIAFASDSQLADSAQRLLTEYGFTDVAVSQLSEAQLSELQLVDTSSDKSEAMIRAQIRSIIDQ